MQGKGGRGKESVYVKASGRAIPRALEVGNWFQGQADCAVSVQMGSVAAIDDIEVDDVVGSEKGKEGDEDVDMVDADATGEERDADRKRDTSGERSKQRGHDEHVEEIPESRIRTLSTVAVSIRLK